MELALSLEKLNFQKLRDLWKIADKHTDPALCDFIGATISVFLFSLMYVFCRG